MECTFSKEGLDNWIGGGGLGEGGAGGCCPHY